MNHTRRGYTLSELILILLVLGLLGGMLAMGLAPVSGARTSCRRSNCINNQHQVSLALIRYEFDRQRYPGWAVNQNPDASGLGGREASWVFAITPYLDRADIYNYYGTSRNGEGRRVPVPQETLKILWCSATSSQPNAWGGYTRYGDGPAGEMATHYVVNTGYYHDAVPYRDRREHSAVGVFTYQYRASPGDVRTFTGAGSVVDGLAQTLLLTENAEAGTWLGRSKTGDTTDRVEEACIGFAWLGSEPIPALNQHVGAVSDCTARRIGPGAALPRPSSRHLGGVVATFCDGHTRFLNDDIDPGVYQRLCTPRRAIVDLAYQPMEPQPAINDDDHF